MLDSLRSASKSWIVKILFGLLILSFGIWGVGDFVRGPGSGGTAIRVGNVEVSGNQVSAEFNREVSRLRQMLGGRLTAEDAKQLGLLDRTVETIVARLLLEDAARDWDIRIGDDTLRTVIAATKVFHNDKGVFDRAVYLRVLQTNNLTEAAYEDMLRRELARDQLLSSLTQAAYAPKTLVDTLYRHRNERRVAETLTLTAEGIQLPEPTAEQLADFHTKNSQSFRAPEYRALTLVTLTRADVSGDAKVSQEALEEAYRQRIEEFKTGEMRNIEQILFPDEAKAKQALAALKAGKNFKDVAKEISGQAPDIIGWIERDGLLPELAQPVFAIAGSGITDPIQTPLGWHIFRVLEAKSGKTKSLDEVKDQLAADLGAEASVNALYDLGNKLEDKLGGGANLDEAAKSLGLKTAKIAAVDQRGLTPEGKPADLPKIAPLLPLAFQTTEGRESTLTETEDGYFVVRVDKVTPASVQPLDRVKDKVRQAWLAERKAEAANRRAEEALARVKAGEAMEKIAREMKAKHAATAPFLRADNDPAIRLPGAIVAQMFAVKPGAAVSAPAGEGGESVMVAKLISIVPADPAKDADHYASLDRGLRQILSGDIYHQYLARLRTEKKVLVDKAQLDRIGSAQ